MDERTRRLALPFLSFLFGVIGLGVAAFFVLGPERPGAASSLVGGPFSLTDQTGATVTDKALVGKPSLVFFGFTHCPDVCPTTLYELTQLYTALGKDADKLGAYFITVDPERDTPDQLKLYLSSFDPHIVGLTGSREAVEPVLKGYRVYAKKVPTSNGEYTMDHTALVYLMDKSGRFVGAFNLQRPPAEAAKDLAKYF
jgi:protein SCO1/2